MNLKFDDMTNSSPRQSSIQTSISPWFTVRNGVKAVEFYKSAFGAVETYRLEMPDGSVVKLLEHNLKTQ